MTLESLPDLAARTFDEDPFYQWLFPRRRVSKLRALMALALRRARVEVTDGGFIAWHAPDVELAGSSVVDVGPALRVLASVRSWHRLVIAWRVLRALARAHPLMPHVHLELLAVDPAMQGRGIARRLMEGLLAHADRHGWPVVLETTNPANPEIYRRFGFETIAEIRIGAAPRAWVMQRPAGDTHLPRD